MDSIESKKLRISTELDDETIAKKRSRRVSFADTTAVHVFDRDEDFETPPDSKAGSGETSSVEPESEAVGFRGDQSDSDDSKFSAREEEDEDEDEDDEEDGEQERFVRDMDSSSPGSAIGSVTSNEDDNYFGPVSTSFIRSDQFSESGMSDDNNHDITLDSTAFSMHFRNIVPLDDRTANSRGSLQTPTGDSMPSDSGSFMIPTGFKKQIPHTKVSDGKMSAGASSSSNMSLIVENPHKHKYDYGKLSPGLEALLAEVNKSMQANSPNVDSKFTTFNQHRNEASDPKVFGNEETNIRNMAPQDDVVNDGVSDSHISNGCSIGIPTDRIGNGNRSPNIKGSLPIDKSVYEKPQLQGMISPMVKDSSKEVRKAIQSDVLFSSVQSTEILSPPNRKSQNNFISQSDHAHRELVGDQTGVRQYYSNSSPVFRPKVPAFVNTDDQLQSLAFEGGTHTPKFAQNAAQSFHSPLQGSVSSLCAKRQQLFLDSAVPSHNKLVHSSAGEQPPSSLKMEVIRHGERISAIKNSISKFKILETPVLINSRSALSMQDHLPFDIGDILDKETDGPNATQGDVFVSVTEESLINAAQKTGHQEISVDASHSGFETPNKMIVLKHSGENEVNGDNSKLTEAISSFHFLGSRTNVHQNPLTNHNPTEGESTPNVHGSSQRQETAELKENIQVLDGIPEHKFSVSQEGHFTPRAERSIRSSSLLEENRVQSPTPFIASGFNKLRNLGSPKQMAKLDFPYHNSQNDTGSSRNLHSGNQDESVETRKGLIDFTFKLRERERIASSNESASADTYKGTAAINRMKEHMAEENVKSLSNEINHLTDNNILHSFSPMDPLSPKPTRDSRLQYHGDTHQDLHALRESSSVQADVIIRKKRRIDEIPLLDKEHICETGRSQKSPKCSPQVMGSTSGFLSGHYVECDNALHDIGGQAPLKHWTDILSKASEATKQLFSPSIDKLKSRELDILEDMLGELQRARKYERLRSEITSLRNHGHFGGLPQQRVAEVRYLQDKLVHEHAKLQLKHVKLDLLRKKAQSSQSGIQECHKLKSTLTQQVRLLGMGDAQNKERRLHSVSSDSTSKNKEEHNRMTSLKHELEMLDKKVKPLMKSFEASCKIKGNLTCDRIIEVVNDHLEMKNRRRVIQQDLQLWQLSDIVNKNDQCDIVLNYCNLLSQRFTINISPSSSIVVNNLLNDANIGKNFPNLNALTAFEFIFKAKGDRIIASSKCFQQETLVTSFLLGTLLDVLEEVQVARIEMLNLICSTFHSQCSGQLELQLCFINFKSGRKLTFSLEMTDLNCAVYPSEPSELQIQISRTQTTFPPSISDEITGAVQSLQGGRSMIIRLCRCISRLVSASI